MQKVFESGKYPHGYVVQFYFDTFDRFFLRSGFRLGFVFLFVFRERREKYPNVVVRLYEGTTPYLLSRLDEGLCEAALVRTPYTLSPSYYTEKVYSDKMVVLASEKLPTELKIEDLVKYPLILTHRYASMLTRLAHRAGLNINAPVQCEELATCIALAEVGLGVTMIPRSSYANYAAHGSKLHAIVSESV